MCLITKGRKAQIAKEDIPCYKVLKLTNAGIFVTPFMFDAVNPCRGNTMDAVGDLEFKKSYKGGYQLDGGVIHCFSNYRHASYFVREEELLNSCCFYKIFSCVIPKGTKYYSGKFTFGINNEYDSIATKKIKFL